MTPNDTRIVLSFEVALRGEVQSQLASQRYADGATPLHMAAMCLVMWTCFHVYIRYSTPDLQICFIQLTIHMWWIQCDYSKNPEWFFVKWQPRNIMGPSDGSSKGLESKNH